MKDNEMPCGQNHFNGTERENRRIIHIRKDDIEGYEACLCRSAEETIQRMRESVNQDDPMQFLYQLKFSPGGRDPLDTSRTLNLVEQLNQTFTYLASLKGARFLFDWHKKEITCLTLNLGTAGGSDIETKECGGIAAEVFAAVDPWNNQKLKKDVKKVLEVTAQHRYVFFMSPLYPKIGLLPGDTDKEKLILKMAEEDTKKGVIVWSLGCAPMVAG